MITDKAIIARRIAASLTMDVKTEGAGYFEGHGFRLVWTDGALLSLSAPENRLAKSDLPCIPVTFTISVRSRKTKKGAIEDKAALRQLETVRKVFDECNSIIVATDAGEEGERTFRDIYSFLECDKPFRRLWLNSLTASAIREGLKNLGEGAWYDNLYATADCRRKAGFLVNIHAGSAFSPATGLVNYPLGRLQIPALAMVCRRCAEHRRFVPERFHEHRITLEKDGLFQRFSFPGSIKNRRRAEKLYEYLKTFRTAQIIKIETHSRIQPAPALYSLTALQMDTHLRHGFPASKTMEIARKLYEGKLISHPLADSRHIPGEVFETIPKILRRTAAYCGPEACLNSMDWENLNRRSVGQTDTFGHHALIPTGVCPGYLSGDDKKVYTMIACRTMEAFAPDCQKEVIRLEVAAGNLVLSSGQSQIITPGWRSVVNREEDKEQDEAREKDCFPRFTEGETLRISGWNLLTLKTRPCPLYTEADLLGAMESASLGTAASRAAVIESLFSCGILCKTPNFPC